MELSPFGHDCPLRCSPIEERPPGTYEKAHHLHIYRILTVKVKTMSRMFLILFSAVALCAVISAAPSRQKRGFRNAALSTARGFGKRMQQSDEMALHEDLSRPMASTWFAEQVARSPALAKYLVEKVIDQNGDGLIHPDEVYQSL
ncbi:EF-hand domain-containing protein [Caerostris darwini]|uniref:EF-hand domain-containing protein n=1 Tax=Caerostris darwini TaxID=1538125 RepID=A0AAV4TKH3_9ARAC|nr:EF-hand domain-containing protein [Caerostris darwini]